MKRNPIIGWSGRLTFIAALSLSGLPSVSCKGPAPVDEGPWLRGASGGQAPAKGGAGGRGGAGGAGGAGGGPVVSCQLNGVTYPLTNSWLLKDGFPCGDGCNTCWCTSLGIVGTTIGCNFGGAGGAGGGGGAAAAAGAGGQAGNGGAGGQAGNGGAGGQAGNGGAGGMSAAPPAGPCHTNADCPTGAVCVIAAAITSCDGGQVGECVPRQASVHCTFPGLHGPCDCVGGEATLQCGTKFPGTACNGPLGGYGLDYTTPTSCLGCFPAPEPEDND